MIEESRGVRVIFNCISNYIFVQEELKETLGNTKDAEMLHKALHENCLSTDEKSSVKVSKVRGKQLFTRVKRAT